MKTLANMPYNDTHVYFWKIDVLPGLKSRDSHLLTSKCAQFSPLLT